MGNCLDCRAYGPREDAHTNKSDVDTAALLASSNDASKGKGDPVAVPEQVIAERPRPLVFALMRNGHEVLRGAMEDISDYLEKENKDTACAAYLEFHRWSALHKLMEDGHNDGKTPKGMFAMLDEEFDGIAQKNGLRDDHNTLDVIEDGLTAACNNKNTSLEALKALWDEYKTAYLTHLKKEEGVMMPQVVQLKNRGENLTVIMQTEILPLVSTAWSSARTIGVSSTQQPFRTRLLTNVFLVTTLFLCCFVRWKTIQILNSLSNMPIRCSMLTPGTCLAYESLTTLCGRVLSRINGRFMTNGSKKVCRQNDMPKYKGSLIPIYPLHLELLVIVCKSCIFERTKERTKVGRGPRRDGAGDEKYE